MIGQLVLPVYDPASSPERKVRLRATLNDDMSWSCGDPEWASVLNAQFTPPVDGSVSPSAGRFLLYRAAERLGAQVTLGEAESQPAL